MRWLATFVADEVRKRALQCLARAAEFRNVDAFLYAESRSGKVLLTSAAVLPYLPIILAGCLVPNGQFVVPGQFIATLFFLVGNRVGKARRQPWISANAFAAARCSASFLFLPQAGVNSRLPPTCAETMNDLS
jgi:hypothetical protein